MVLMSSLLPPNVVQFLREMNVILRMKFSSSSNSEIVVDHTFHTAGYTHTEFLSNLSTEILVLVSSVTFLALSLYFVDYYAIRKKNRSIPRLLKQFLTSFITFAYFFFTYCLLEIYLCAMIDIKNNGSASSWVLILIITIAPLLAVSYFLWNFEANFGLAEEKIETETVQPA